MIQIKVGHRVKLVSDLADLLLTCNSCVPAPGLGCRSGVRPLPPDGRHLGGALVRVGDAGAVLLVGVCALLAVAQPVTMLGVRGADGVHLLCGLLVERSGAVCGHFLPLKPAGQRRVGLEVKVPAAAVLLGDLLQPLLQVPAQLLLVHRAEQAPADRLSALDGVHRANGWSSGWRRSRCCCLVSCGQHNAAGRFKGCRAHRVVFVHNEQRLLIGCSSLNWRTRGGGRNSGIV